MPERMAILFLRKFGSQLSGRPHSAQRARTQDLFDIRKMSLEGIKLVFQNLYPFITTIYTPSFNSDHNRTLVIIASYCQETYRRHHDPYPSISRKKADMCLTTSYQKLLTLISIQAI